MTYQDLFHRKAFYVIRTMFFDYEMRPTNHQSEKNEALGSRYFTKAAAYDRIRELQHRGYVDFYAYRNSPCPQRSAYVLDDMREHLKAMADCYPDKEAPL